MFFSIKKVFGWKHFFGEKCFSMKIIFFDEKSFSMQKVFDENMFFDEMGFSSMKKLFREIVFR
jgi:hypothetical protein